MPVVTNQSGHRAVVLSTATETIVVAGNTSVSNIAAPNEQGPVVGASVSKLAWSTNGTITVARGANTLAVLSGSDHWDLRQMSLVLGKDAAANLVVTITGGGTLITELSKTF